MTKREITTSVINALGRHHDHELYERVKDRVVMMRAELLRQSMARHGVDTLLEQSYEVEMIKKMDVNSCMYLESKCKVFMPVRAQVTTSPFRYVGTLMNIPYTFLRVFEINTIPNIPINEFNKYYSVTNMKIRIYNSTAKKIIIRDVLEDFKSLDVDCTGSCEDDDTLLPMPADFAGTIIKALTTEFRQLEVKPLEEVED